MEKKTGKKSKSPAKRQAEAVPGEGLDFAALVAAIRQVHEQCATQASRAVNVTQLGDWLVCP